MEHLKISPSLVSALRDHIAPGTGISPEQFWSSFAQAVQVLGPKNKAALAFGSHGWSGGGAEQAAELLKESGFELIDEVISCQYRPDEQTIDKCSQAGKKLAAKGKAVGE